MYILHPSSSCQAVHFRSGNSTGLMEEEKINENENEREFALSKLNPVVFDFTIHHLKVISLIGLIVWPLLLAFPVPLLTQLPVARRLTGWGGLPGSVTE